MGRRLPGHGRPDGRGNSRTEYEALESAVLDIAARGLGYGIHLVLTASRAMEAR